MLTSLRNFSISRPLKKSEFWIKKHLTALLNEKKTRMKKLQIVSSIQSCKHKNASNFISRPTRPINFARPVRWRTIDQALTSVLRNATSSEGLHSVEVEGHRIAQLF